MKPGLFTLSVALLILAGCGRQGDSASDQDAELPAASAAEVPRDAVIDRAKRAMAGGDLAAAEKLVRAAMLRAPDDVATLRLAAEIAFADGRPSDTAALVAEAAVANGFADEQLVQNAVLAYVGTGQLFELIELLDQVVAAFPQRHDTRRLLFDFLVNAEDHYRAAPHGRILVRQRQFDRVLLFSLATIEQRNMETNSMVELQKRNPDDPRLRIAEVRSKVDRGQWDGVEATLLQILRHSPGYPPAQILLGQYLVYSHQSDRIAQWIDCVTEATKDRWQYWALLGDVARQRGNEQQAARAYLESVRKNPDIGEVLAKLARTLERLRREDESVDAAMIAAINHRAELLSRFSQEKERLYKLGNRSGAIMAQMSRTLVQLGRLWEAEAWTAYAMTIPDDDIAAVRATRRSIVKQLTADTSWQRELDPLLATLDLSDYPMPDTDLIASSKSNPAEALIRPSVKPVLRDETDRLGLAIDDDARRNRHTSDGVPLYAQMESGGCAIDYDLDGWSDLYVAAAGGTPGETDSANNSMFRNLGGRYANVTAGTDTNDTGFAQGVTFGDVNEDGFPDLVVLNYGPDRIFINNADGTFTPREDWFSSDRQSPWSTSGAIADLNNDGISDFVCLKYCAGMEPATVACQKEDGTVSLCLPTKFAADRDAFFRGRPGGGFEEVTDRWAATPVQPGRGLGLVIGDLDATGGMDVFVANDMTHNHYWTFNDQGELDESATLRGLAVDARFRPQACMGIATADLDADGDVDFFVTNFEQEHNTFYEQTEHGIWADQTTPWGLRQVSYSQLGFGTQAVDFDNDSNLELAITNGHVYQDAEPPSSYAQQMQVLHRVSHDLFEAFEFDTSDGYVADDHVGRAMWTFDADRDGRMDLAITHQREPFKVLMNRTPTEHPWVRFRLVGVEGARDAVGASITVQTEHLTRFAPVVAGDGFYCANERVTHFGLGPDHRRGDPISVSVRWPDGTEDAYQVGENRTWLIVQGDDQAFAVSRNDQLIY
ncbi:FG-GAP repeat protein [Stieleria maiorica]|uniref:FG-GAP repeat protein n=1 Tax=Stieleria maiorica TaxID=2795974 RepID=A0A5B9MA13_9BACT|nr:FG-GAP-like repeat-containing protein [Stieleria maiorica]QEF97066.1 FG-GAP repeat protein [Stieleria maiorica]